MRFHDRGRSVRDVFRLMLSPRVFGPAALTGGLAALVVHIGGAPQLVVQMVGTLAYVVVHGWRLDQVGVRPRDAATERPPVPADAVAALAPPAPWGYRVKTASLVALTAAFAIGGLIVASASVPTALRARDIARTGRSAEATVLADVGGSAAVVYRVEWRQGDDTHVADVPTVADPAYDDGEPVMIVFDPTDPRRAALADDASTGSLVGALAWGGISLPFVAGAGWYAWRRRALLRVAPAERRVVVVEGVADDNLSLLLVPADAPATPPLVFSPDAVVPRRPLRAGDHAVLFGSFAPGALVVVRTIHRVFWAASPLRPLDPDDEPPSSA